MKYSNQTRGINIKCIEEVVLGTNLRFSLWDTSQEDEIGHEEADAEVQVDGGAGPIDGAAELERQDAQDQAQQRDDQAQLGHQ